MRIRLLNLRLCFGMRKWLGGLDLALEIKPPGTYPWYQHHMDVLSLMFLWKPGPKEADSLPTHVSLL